MGKVYKLLDKINFGCYGNTATAEDSRCCKA